MSEKLGVDFHLPLFYISLRDTNTSVREDLVSKPHQAKLEYLCAIGDTGFKGKKCNPGNIAEGIYHPIVSISVSADKAINEHYKQGDELRDIVIIGFIDNCSFIKGGYRGETTRRVNEYIFANDPNLQRRTIVMAPKIGFYLAEPPTLVLGEDISFTIQITFSNGAVCRGVFPASIPSTF